MDGYQQAVQFNNHGVALLASGNNEQREAIAKFRCALAVIKAGIIVDAKDQGTEHLTDSRSSHQLPGAAMQMDQAIGGTQANYENVNCESSDNSILVTEEDVLEPIVVPFPGASSDEDDETFFFYHHGFIISPSPSASSNSSYTSRCKKRSCPGASPLDNDMMKKASASDEFKSQVENRTVVHSSLSLDVLSSVVVFNMALAHNVEEAFQSNDTTKATVGTGKSAALKDVSRRLYDMSLSLLGNALRTHDVSKSTIDAMVVLTASSNNISKLLFDQGQIESARSMLKTLWFTTSWICEKVLLPQQQRKVLLSQEMQQRTLSSQISGGEVSSTPTVPTGPDVVMLRRGMDATIGQSLGDIESSFPPQEGTRTPEFLFSETEMEGFMMNVMLMYHSQPPTAAKAA